jgi:hypothetical protein
MRDSSRRLVMFIARKVAGMTRSAPASSPSSHASRTPFFIRTKSSLEGT